MNQLHSQTMPMQGLALHCISSRFKNEHLDYFTKLLHNEDYTSGQCHNRSPKQVHSGLCSFNLFLVKFTISMSENSMIRSARDQQYKNLNDWHVFGN